MTAQRTANAGETSPGTGTPVLVVVDDEDHDVVKRSSGIAKRALEALADSMQRYGLRMELLDVLEEIGESDKAEHVHRARVLLRLQVSARSRLDTAASLRIGVGAQILSAPDGLLLDEFELPRERIPLEPGCMESTKCIQETVDKAAKWTMRALAEKLRATLEPLR